MDKIETDGSGAAYRLEVPSLGMVTLRAPGMRVSVSSIAPSPQLALTARVVVEPPLDPALRAALDEHAIVEVPGRLAVHEATPMPTARFSDTLSPLDNDESHVLVSVPADADTGMLAMVDDGYAPLWFVPAPKPMSPAFAGRSPALGARAAAPRAPASHDFYLPRAVLSRSDAALSLHALGGAGHAIVRFFKFKWVEELIGAGLDKLALWIAEHIEQHQKKEGLKLFEDDKASSLLSPHDIQARAAGKRALLLVHGIFSSVDGGFGELRASPFLAELRKVYQDRIFGWDHFTVAKGALANASELLQALPDGLDVDVICHSRGGVVTRCALEHPQLAAAVTHKLSRVRKVAFVAAANRGSLLAAEQNIDKLLNVFSLIGTKLGGGVALGVVMGALKLVAQSIRRLPGILDMDPNAQVIKTINADGMSMVDGYVALRANFEPGRGFARRLLDLGADKIFEGAANDLVVPFDGAYRFDSGTLSAKQPLRCFSFGSATEGQGEVLHTNFFKQPRVTQLLGEELLAP